MLFSQGRGGIAARKFHTCESRAQVDELVAKAVAAGGSTNSEPADYGFMYQHDYQDLDGHNWGLIWMDPSAIQ